ncbi:MAG: cytochrome c-type biogenesis protein CcmH [Anaerolineaceae bacterium]|nr:cytochrome c-type biogenesis protein CcmH [Anaerolineaceae bacterium]
MKLFTGILFFMAVCFALAFAPAGLAQGSAPPAATPVGVTDNQVNAIARELYCPVCENVPLDVCPTQACAQWRDLIRQKLNDGWSEAQIQEYFALQYGDRVLAEPPRRGLNWLVYILPPLIFLVGVFIVFRTLRALRKAPGSSAQEQAPAPAPDPYVARLEEELKRREKE